MKDQFQILKDEDGNQVVAQVEHDNYHITERHDGTALVQQTTTQNCHWRGCDHVNVTIYTPVKTEEY
jgi:hypothetical protein